MGQQIDCRGFWRMLSQGTAAESQAGAGTAWLEEDVVRFRGPFRASLPLATIRSATANAGKLTIRAKSGVLILELGPAAEKWVRLITQPKGLLEKLGIKPGLRVSVIGPLDAAFLADLQKHGAEVTTDRARRHSELIFFAVNHARDLQRIATLRRALAPAGALWTVRPKGRPDIGEALVMAAGKAAGLVDVKVVKFSATHTAEKFVIPKKDR